MKNKYMNGQQLALSKLNLNLNLALYKKLTQNIL